MRLLVHLLSADAKAPCDMTCHASVCDLNVCYNVCMSVSNVYVITILERVSPLPAERVIVSDIQSCKAAFCRCADVLCSYYPCCDNKNINSNFVYHLMV